MSARSESPTAVGTPPREEQRPGLRRPAGIVGGVLGALCLLRFGLGAQGLIAAFMAVVLAVLSAIDLEERRLPNRIVLPAAAAVLLARLAFFPDRTLEWVLAALGAALFLFLPLFVSPGGIGMGDVKLALLLGVGLGVDVVLALVIACFSAAAVGLVVVLRGGIAARKTAIPFGPFLALGSIATLLLGGGSSPL